MNIPKLAIHRPIFITCLFLLIMTVGYLALKRLPVDLFPDITFPVVTVTTTYPGAGPLEVESLVSKPIEDEISTIAGIKTIRSTNREGVSSVVAQFHFKTDIKYAEQQIRDRIGSARKKLPDDIDDPVIRRVDPSDEPIVTVGVTADLPTATLYDFADEIIRPKLQQVDEVGMVEILGGRKREIRVELQQEKLKRHELSAGMVSDRIRSAGENIPAGSVQEGKNQIVYRTLAQFRSLEDISATIVSFFANEKPIRVRDVGHVFDSLQEERSRVFLNGTPSLVLRVYKQSGSNTIQVVEGLRKRIEDLNKEFGGRKEKVRVAILRDNSTPIRANVTDVKESIFIGIALTVLVVLYFLGSFRSTFITTLALPNSLLGAFVLMLIAGFSINIMSLLALSLAVGLLVDDAIVVRENIFRHFEMGKPAAKAAVEGTNEVLLAVIATTLTVVAVFGPIGFLDGTVGQFFKEFGLTICFAMAISLLDAIAMAPMLSAYFAGAGSHAAESKKPMILLRPLNWSIKLFDRFQTRLENGYERSLGWILRFPKTVLALALGIFISSLFAAKFIPKTFLPPQDNGEFIVRIDLPPGTSLDGTHELARQVDERIRSNPEVRDSLMIVGSRDGQANIASFMVQLVPSKARQVNTTGMKNRIREQLVEFARANPIVGDMNGGTGSDRPFTLVILGPDLEQLEKYSNAVYEKLKGNPALKDVNLTYRPGKPEFQFLLDPNRADQLGVATKTAGIELRTLVEGMVPAVFREQGREYDIRVRLGDAERDLKSRVNKTFVPNINGRLVPLSQVSEAREQKGPAEISRHNRNRSVRIEADIAPGGPGMGGAITAATRLIDTELKLPEGISYTFVGQAESFKELIVNMAIAMGLGILFIYLVLASLYESFITPFAIMLVLPLALCGAFFALLITGSSLDLFSMIGCVLLMGVATKNSILMVDYTKQLTDKGVDLRTAIIRAGKTRLRPILMTSFALIAGMIPIAIGLNEASRQRTGMGIGIIGGMFSSTLLTLAVIPAAYTYIERFRIMIESWFKRHVSGSSADQLSASPSKEVLLANEQ